MPPFLDATNKPIRTAVSSRYFKYKNFQLKLNHEFDIGHPVPYVAWLFYFSDRHFVNKLLSIHPSKVGRFYDYHLHHFKSSNVLLPEKLFYRKVMLICEHFSSIYRAKAEKSLFRRKQVSYEKKFEKLELAFEILKKKNGRNRALEGQELIQRLTLKLESQQQEINALKKIIKEKVQPDASKIIIPHEYFETFIELIIQIRDLEIKENDKLLVTSSQLTWVRMLSHHFALANYEPISINKLRKYFYGERKRFLKSRKFKVMPLESK